MCEWVSCWKNCLFMHAYEFLCLLYIHVWLSWWYLFVIYGCFKEKGKTLFCAKIGIVMPLLSFKFNAQIQGGVSLLFDELSRFYFKSEIPFVLSSITKKGEIESASRHLTDFGDWK